jgi:uncharacterized protein with von Willebrand factor type A (vWA) domain
MFLPLYHSLRSLQVPVSLTEWLTLMQGLAKGLHYQSLEDFYFLARSLLVKDVAYYDAFDQAFRHCFKAGPLPDLGATKEQILAWLESPAAPLQLSDQDLDGMRALSLDELLAQLAERLREQKTAHEEGQKWVGSGGTSAFGSYGSHPSGISFAAESGGGNALMTAFPRRYRNLRRDLTLDIRQISVALKRLRKLRDAGADEVLDLDATIDKTCRNAGEIELVFAPERRNQVRLLLVMDTGGSMEPYRRLSERLFSAANKLNHFKDFRAFYFHNCIYDKLYTDFETNNFVTTAELMREYGKRYRLILVGDAAMSPHELFSNAGNLQDQKEHATQGIDWLRQVATAFPQRAWLNPLSEKVWGHYETVGLIKGLFPMFPLTVKGLGLAVRQLLKSG